MQVITSVLNISVIAVLLAAGLSFSFVPSSYADTMEATVNATQEDFEQEHVAPPGRKGNILNIILSSVPERSTERGTLVMEAYHDENGDGEYTTDEVLLRNEISCTIDDVTYPLPAFIPGLDYNARYSIKCRGKQLYEPTAFSKNVLVARRGEIITVSIPCNKVPPQE